MNRLLPIIGAILLLPACSTTSDLQRKEHFLSSAGFRTITPSTPSQKAKLQSLPQGHITQVTRKGKTLFMLADAVNNRLLVGNNAQFEKYQRILYAEKIDPARAQQKIIKLDDAAWGPWDGLYGPFDPFWGPMMFY